jgi:hypothetical protein
MADTPLPPGDRQSPGPPGEPREARAIKVRGFVASWSRDGESARAAAPDAPGPGWLAWRLGNLTVCAAPRASGDPPIASTDELPPLILGDDSAHDPSRRDGPLGHGISIRYDPAARTLVAITSLAGLPPLYQFVGPEVTALASDIHLLSDVAGVRLELDSRAVTELGTVGHPLEHHSLFQGVVLAPAAVRLSLAADDGAIRSERVWSLSRRVLYDWPTFIEAQQAAFEAAVRRLDTRGAFLSLTAGLDTRTVFAALAAAGRLVPACTMTGPTPSLDARIAGRLCRAYGVAHEPVIIGEQFEHRLVELVERASLLSGGLETLAQAPEVFLYEELKGQFSARISGNLGNQVGRRGTEGVSVRGADVAILAPRLRHEVSEEGWRLGSLDHTDEALEFLLHSEFPLRLVGNYGVGSHFAVQVSPYADGALLETLSHCPPGSGATASRLVLRLRDLRHRFLGEPAARSFQRTLVARLGGYASKCPVNWGWRPSGGVSLSGAALGLATLAGMYARRRGFDDGILRAPLDYLGLPALHDFRDSRRWLRRRLRDYVRDVLGSAEIRERDLFDAAVLGRTLDEHFTGARDHFQTVTYALDLALAVRTFCGSPGSRARRLSEGPGRAR